MNTSLNTESIVAIATPPGRGGVGIVRVSGSQCREVAEAMLGKSIVPRHAHYGAFLSHDGRVLDEGIALFFEGPNSFTGEDVLELQAHGGPIILDLILQEISRHSVRLARPGEFSERAFLNDKLDLSQAEAIADLIDASSEQAARNAIHSLQGVFSNKIHSLVETLIQLRIYVEAAIDFPEEEIDFLSDGKVKGDLDAVITHLDEVFQEAKQGVLVREGMKVVIAGRPNAGKSSLLNLLAGRDTAIVSSIEGTTRDILREHIHIDGMPLHIIDTAGLRESPDEVEQIGIARAWKEIESADRVLLMVDSTAHQDLDPHKIWPEFVDRLPDKTRLSVIANKADLSQLEPGFIQTDPTLIALSAQTGEGLETLKQHLKDVMGFTGAGEGGFTARRRHLDALSRAESFLQAGQQQLNSHAAGELLAEDLRQAQNSLSEITGAFNSDDLLGRIFSSFCIGK